MSFHDLFVFCFFKENISLAPVDAVDGTGEELQPDSSEKAVQGEI